MNTLVFDLGGTKCDAGVFDAKWNLLKKERIFTKAQEGKNVVIGQLLELAAKFWGKFEIKKCVIGVPGRVENDRQTVVQLPNIKDFENINLGRIFEENFSSLECVVENDANLFALGAYQVLKSQAEILIGITLGTGIGGGIVSKGKLWRGASGLAGEFGHMVIDLNGVECHCGQKGCWEKYASANALIQKVEELNLFEGKITTEVIEKALSEKNNLVLEKLNETVDYLAIGLANVIHALDPNIIVLGGSLGMLLPYYKSDLVKKIENRLLGKQMVCEIMNVKDENVQLKGGVFFR